MAGQFLDKRDPLRWTTPEGLPRTLTPAGPLAQPTRSGLDVALGAALSRPSAAVMRNSHKAWRAGLARPVLMVALPPSPIAVRASICRPAGDAPPMFASTDPPHVERIADLSLAEPTHHAAFRFWAAALTSMSSIQVGLASLRESARVRRTTQPVCTRRYQ